MARFRELALTLALLPWLDPPGMLVTRIWWPLREIELAAIELPDVQVDDPAASVTLFLGASKTDPYTKGVYRTHGCSCPPGPVAEDRAVCPYHAVAGLVRGRLAGAASSGGSVYLSRGPREGRVERWTS